MPENIKYQCYTFERKRFGLDENYLAAKAHYRFLPTTRSTYVHGGLTPEETLVPVVVFTPLTISPKRLVVRLLRTEFYFGRKSEIPLEIVNTNAYACENMSVEVRSPAVEAARVEMGTLAAMSRDAVTLEGRFRRSRGELSSLQLRITYDFLDQPQQQDVEVPIEMKSMMTTAFDVRELME